MSVIWEPANDIRKKLNLITPIVTIATAFLWLIPLSRTVSPFEQLFTSLFSLFSPATPFAGRGWIISEMILGIVAGVLYLIPKLGPYMGIKNDEVYLWPDHIMMIVCTVLAWWGSFYYIGGALMSVQCLMVIILGSDPIWEVAKTK